MKKRGASKILVLLLSVLMAFGGMMTAAAAWNEPEKSAVLAQNGFRMKEDVPKDTESKAIEEPVAARGRKTENMVLLKLGNISITRDMEMEQVKSILGNPKLVTKSLLGGSAYAFYSGNYENYVYLETDGQGDIVGYGSISPGFETDKHKYGDIYDRHYWFMSGYQSETFEERKIQGAVDYVRDRITSESYEAAYLRFQKDVECRLGVAKQACEMANALWAVEGVPIQKEFSEDTFYLMEQIREKQGISGYDYFTNAGKGSYYQLISTGLSQRHVDRFDRCFPNPLELSWRCNQYNIGDAYIDSNLAYYYDKEGSICTEVSFINPDFMEVKQKVPYTLQEQQLLAVGIGLYQESLDLWNNQETYYEEEPAFKTLPLNPGKIHEDKMRATVQLLNAIRAAAGIEQLEYSPEITEAAQNKAVMVSYANSNGLKSGHYLPQHEGISDEMYQSGMRYMNENLYMCGILGGYVITSITQALDDGYGDPWKGGHRYNLLDPEYAAVGFGEAGGQAVHKFGGVNNSNVEMVAWPSKGIAALESINNDNLNWTVKFYKNYTVTGETTVQVKLLNNGQKWNFSKKEIPSCELYDSVRYQIFSGGNQLAFFNSEIVLEQGNVYEIKIDGLKDQNGNECSYEYRTVCEKFYKGEGSQGVAGVSVNPAKLSMAVGSRQRLFAEIIPENAANPMVVWRSEDEQVAQVNQFGVVTAKAPGTVTLYAMTLDGSYEASCLVKVSDRVPVSSITVSPSNKTIKVGEQTVLTAQILPEEATNKQVRWVSENKAAATVDENGKVTGVGVGTAQITAISEEDNYSASSLIFVTGEEPVKKVPGQVSGLRAIKQTTKSITLAWDSVAGADSYQISRYDTETKRWIVVGKGNKNSFTDNKRRPGVVYQYCVAAVNDAGQGKTSAALKAASKPDKPILKLQKKGRGKIILSWKKLKADKIEIAYKWGKKKYKTCKTVSGKKTSYTVSKLKKGRTYQFKIRGYVKNGNKLYGDYSNVKRKTVK